MPVSRTFIPYLAITGLMALAVWAYWPGLYGTFLFDDFINLPSLGSDGPTDQWPTFLRYLTSGHADPTGRPLALLSFLIDAHDWPADPLPFKRTNLILHLINAFMLAALLDKLSPLYERSRDKGSLRSKLAAVIGAGIWLLHPFLVSTTLYVVQREAMLPATFTFAGLLLWLQGRKAMLFGKPVQGQLWLLAGLGLCTALAVLSKANGVLLPLLALCIEFTIPHRKTDDLEPASRHPYLASPRRNYRTVMWILAGLPSLLVAGYLTYAGWLGTTHDLSSIRPWTLGQRMLTEPRVIAEYLKYLWLPRPFTTGLFNDQVAASTSLLAPPSTLWSVALLAGLIGSAIFLRRSHPRFSLAVLFYFLGQSMESSTIPLELYFEHRNYLPSALLFWPLTIWLCDACTTPLDQVRSNLKATSKTLRWVKAATAVLLVLGLATMTHARASLWGNSHDQALLWAKLNPDSPRAQANAAMADVASGHPDRAAARLRPLLQKDPAQIQLALNLLSADCALGRIEPATLLDSRRALELTRDTGTLLTSWFERVIDQLDRPPCPELTGEALAGLLNAAKANTHFSRLPGRRQDLLYLQGRLALKQGHIAESLTFFDRALDEQVRPGIALRQAALLGSTGHPAQGLAHLDYFDTVRNREERPAPGMPRIHAWVLERQRYWPEELAQLRHTLVADLRASRPTE